jgi:hypothetical protein
MEVATPAWVEVWTGVDSSQVSVGDLTACFVATSTASGTSTGEAAAWPSAFSARARPSANDSERACILTKVRQSRNLVELTGINDDRRGRLSRSEVEGRG